MSDLAKRVRGMANDLNVDFCAPTLNEAAVRIEALVAALREIATECSTFPIKDGLAFRCESIARAALAQEQDPLA